MGVEEDDRAAASAVPQLSGEELSVPPDVTRAYLSGPDVRRMVRRRIRRRIKNHETMRDLLQGTFADALAAADKSPPKTALAMPGWLCTIADRRVADYYKVRARRAPHEGTIDDPDEVAAEPDDADRYARWYIVGWLEKQVEGSPGDEELLDILKDKAINEKKWDLVARERETTARALWNRVARFKKKYLPRWRRHRTLLIAGALLLLALLCAAAYVILRNPGVSPRGQDDTIGPDRPARPIPSAPSSGVSVPSAFEPATGPSSALPASDKPLK